ncbi:hypothetical protein [Bacillus sp. V59.32b]|uniref:hypothetical protein n=1 Tax=Bacillus sp. V59.32b TaxID=1758642 RepID=UPI00135CEF30|nr:hypothetical protein [Bacillus sp. V59.32b]
MKKLILSLATLSALAAFVICAPQSHDTAGLPPQHSIESEINIAGLPPQHSLELND